MKTDDFIVAMTIIGVAAAVNLGFIVYRLLRNPFQYPYFVWWFDVSYKRNVDIRDCIDSFLCNEQNWRALKQHEQSIKQWKHDTENYLQTCILKKRRVRQYQEVLDDNSAFRFGTSRNRTRYKQQNYVKTAYKIPTAESIMAVSWPWLMNRHAQLEEIGFEATLKEYHSKSQRKLMTKALRKEIITLAKCAESLCQMKSDCILITSFRLQKAAKQSRPIYRCYAQNAMGLRALKRAKKILSKNESIAAAEAGFCSGEKRHISTYLSNTTARLVFSHKPKPSCVFSV